MNCLGQSAESVGVQRSTDSDSLGLLDFEQHGTDYEAETFARETTFDRAKRSQKENEEKVRQRKVRRRRG